MNQKPTGARQPRQDLRTPEEKALWEKIRAELAEKRRLAKLPPAEKLPDIWLYDSEHLLKELIGIREIILRIPETLEIRSALQSAIDRIWRVEGDLRFMLSCVREGQHAFAKKAEVDPSPAQRKQPAKIRALRA